MGITDSNNYVPRREPARLRTHGNQSMTDCRNIIRYLNNNLECSNMFYESGAPKIGMFYGKSEIVEYIKQDTSVYAKAENKDLKLICKCEDEETTNFILSALRHCMHRYWDIKILEDDDRRKGY